MIYNLLRLLFIITAYTNIRGDVNTSLSTNASASPLAAPVAIRMHRPTNGSFVIDGIKTLLDVRIDTTATNLSLEELADAVLCVASGPSADPEALIASGREQCWADASPRFLVTTPGTHVLRPYVRSGLKGVSPRLLFKGDAATFTSGPATTCHSGVFGKMPCMITRPNCGRFLKFRFYLYPAAPPLPSRAAAELYQALAASPLRTDDAFAACVYISVNDVRAANVMGEPLEITAAKYARLPLWGSGENHIVFSFGDYGPGFDTGRAMIAASSFGPPLDAVWFAARGGDPSRLPAAVQLRAGYDIVMPLPFFRCNMPMFAHLKKYQDAASQLLVARSPAARPVLLSFKGAAYEFPPEHPAAPRVALKRALHNGRDVIIALTCWALAPNCEPCEPPACTTPPLMNTSTAVNIQECADWTKEAMSR